VGVEVSRGGIVGNGGADFGVTVTAAVGEGVGGTEDGVRSVTTTTVAVEAAVDDGTATVPGAAGVAVGSGARAEQPASPATAAAAAASKPRRESGLSVLPGRTIVPIREPPCG